MTSASTVACVSLALLMAGGASPPPEPDVRPVRTTVAKADVDSTAANRGRSHFVVSSTCDRGRRQTDGLQKCTYHRHRQGDELTFSGLVQPVRNRPIDQEEQGARRDVRRPYRGDAVSCSGQADDRLEDFSQRSVSALLAYEHRPHLIDVLAARPQDRENAAALEIGFERLQPFTYRVSPVRQVDRAADRRRGGPSSAHRAPRSEDSPAAPGRGRSPACRGNANRWPHGLRRRPGRSRPMWHG